MFKGFTPLEKVDCIKAKSLRGFTLIEIIAASVIIVLVAIGTMSVFQSGSNLLAEARIKTEAALLAESTLEQLINLGYSSLPAEGSVSVPSYMLLSKFVDSNKTKYKVENYSSRLKKVTLLIAWNSGKGEMQEEFGVLILDHTNNFE